MHVLIPTGPTGLVGQILPHSSYSCAGVATATGVIEAGYTGSISVILVSRCDLKFLGVTASHSWS